MLNDTTDNSSVVTISGSRLTATTGDLSITAQSGAVPGSTTTTLSATAVAVSGSISVGSGGTAVAISLAGAVALNTASGITNAVVEAGSDLCAGTRGVAGSVHPGRRRPSRSGQPRPVRPTPSSSL